MQTQNPDRLLADRDHGVETDDATVSVTCDAQPELGIAENGCQMVPLDIRFELNVKLMWQHLGEPVQPDVLDVSVILVPPYLNPNVERLFLVEEHGLNEPVFPKGETLSKEVLSLVG